MPSLIQGHFLEATSGILTQRSEMDGSEWVIGNTTVSANTSETTSPSGDNTAEKLEPTAGNALVRQDIITVTANTEYRFSIYFKSATGGNVSLSIFLRTTGLVVLHSQAITVTTSWQRFDVSGDVGDRTQIVFSIGGGSTWSTGEDLYGWGAQLVVVALEDRMVMSDAMAFAFGSKLNLTPSDSMTMTDALAKTLSQRGTLGLKGNFDSYIRKYLNDPGGQPPPPRVDEDQ